jgi:hypothetical protein
MQLPDAAIGSIVAAIVGGTVVFVSAVLTKENKTSEFRQEWIDSLRTDIADFIAGMTEIAAAMRAKASVKEGNPNDILFDNFDLVHKIESLEHRIVLRLNAKEHVRLIQLIRNFRENIIQSHKGPPDAGKALERALIDGVVGESQQILKGEWERVKRGELAFRITKWGAGVAAVVLLIWGITVVLSSHDEAKSSKEETSAAKTTGAMPAAGQTQSVQVVVGTPQVSPTVTRSTTSTTKTIQSSPKSCS